MSEKTVSLFTFNQLDNVKAIEKARNWYKENIIATDDTKEEEIISMIKSKIKELGYDVEDIWYSLTHCQGDGVVFYGKITYETDFLSIISRLLDEDKVQLIKQSFYDCSMSINIYPKSYGNKCSNWEAMEVSCQFDESHVKREYGTAQAEELNQAFDQLEDKIKEEIRTISNHLEREGYEIIESYYADSYVDDQLENNDIYYFLEDGTPIL